MDEKPAGKSYRMVGNAAAKRRHRRSFRSYAQIAMVCIALALLVALVVFAILSDWTIPPRQ